METITIEIANENHSIYREYALTDGQLPDNMQERLQDMVDVLLDDEPVF